MTNTSLPVALEGLLHSLSETSTITSWSVRGTGYMTTLVIRWDSSDRSAMCCTLSTHTHTVFYMKGAASGATLPIPSTLFQ